MANITTVCNVCGGDGIQWRDTDGEGGHECTHCGGTGIVNIGSVDALDTIVAEQASQRADLTAALTQIWNKVKDL